jgi:hypothetical protein
VLCAAPTVAANGVQWGEQAGSLGLSGSAAFVVMRGGGGRSVGRSMTLVVLVAARTQKAHTRTHTKLSFTHPFQPPLLTGSTSSLSLQLSFFDSDTMADTTHPAANDDELVDYDEENEQEEAGKVSE